MFLCLARYFLSQLNSSSPYVSGAIITAHSCTCVTWRLDNLAWSLINALWLKTDQPSRLSAHSRKRATEGHYNLR